MTSIQVTREKDLSAFERKFIIEARVAGVSVTKTHQLAEVSIGTVTKVPSAFRSMGKTSVNGEIVVESIHSLTMALVH